MLRCLERGFLPSSGRAVVINLEVPVTGKLDMRAATALLPPTGGCGRKGLFPPSDWYTRSALAAGSQARSHRNI